jgi:hypothetical protein
MSESFYIDRLANAGVEIDAAGRKFRVAQVTMRHQSQLQAIIRETSPKPSVHAKEYIKGLPEGVATAIAISALKQDCFWPQPVATGEGINILLATEKGQKMLFKCACQGVNKWTDEEVDEIFFDLTAIEMTRVAILAITGEEGSIDPKAETTTPVTPNP